ELQHRQRQRLQRSARLVTMGEMASSIAHELNQPLAAISNYTMGLTARVRQRLAAGEPLDAEELLRMLARTTAQAERASEVIRRVREFVRRSEPERRECRAEAVVANAIALAEIDARRQGLTIESRVAPQLPALHADPILIEQ